MAILNPYLKFGNDCSAFIKVDEKPNLIFLEDGQTIDSIIADTLASLSPTDLKNMGNKEF
jgi:hypothetical protein